MAPLLWRLLPLLLLAATVGALWSVPTVPAAEVRYLRIAVGPTSTPGFQAATSLAGLMSRPPGLPACPPDRPCGVPGLIALAQSLPLRDDIIAAVASGAVETGLVPAGAALAARCQSRRSGADIAVVGGVYQEALHVLVRPGLDLAGPAALKGRRVAMGEPGSEERRLAERVLDAYGLRRTDVRTVPLGGAEALTALRDGRVDALFRLAVWPDAAVADLAAAGQGVLLPVTGEGARRLLDLYPFSGAGTLPAGSYGATMPVETVMQPVVWIARADADPALVRNLAAALAQPANRDRLAAEQSDLSLAEALLPRLAVPLHAGAAAAYGQDAAVMPCPTTHAS